MLYWLDQVGESTNRGTEGTCTRRARETMERASDRTLVLKDGRTLGYTQYGDPMGTPIMLFHHLLKLIFHQTCL